MRDMSSAQAAFDEGRVASRDLVLFEIQRTSDDGLELYGFHTWLGPVTYNGIVYQGAGQVMQISPIGETSDGSAVPLEVTFSSVPNTDLTPQILLQVDGPSYRYKGRPLRVYQQFINTETRALYGTFLMWAGKLDQITHEHEIGGEAVMIIRGESLQLDNKRTGYLVRSDEHQRIIDPNDWFFEHAAGAGIETFVWGGKDSAAQERRTRRRDRSG